MAIRPSICKTVDNLEVKVYDTREDMGREAGNDVIEKMNEILAAQDGIRMIFAAAPSQNELLACLAESHRVDWSRVTAFHMDEYIGLPKDAPQTFGYFLREKLFGRVPMKLAHYIDGTADADEECKRYAALILEKPIDIVCLGIGENGHIAFNDPPVADFADSQIIKRVKLDDECRRQQVNDGCFPSFGSVPEEALTLTIPALLSGRFLYCVVPGKTKTKAVHSALNGPVATRCPASILRSHPDCALYLDRDSYGI